jgi:hypothetical protein
MTAGFDVGDRVRVERDETRWPSRGSWPRYRGKVGSVAHQPLLRRDRCRAGFTHEFPQPHRVVVPAARARQRGRRR